MESTVIIIDDDEICLLLHQKVIEMVWEIHHVHTFNSATKALNFMRCPENLNPMLLFLDINMPDINGWDLLEIIERETFAMEISVIIVSSSVDAADRRKAQQFSQVKGFAEKPLKKDHLQNLQATLPLMNMGNNQQ